MLAYTVQTHALSIDAAHYGLGLSIILSQDNLTDRSGVPLSRQPSMVPICQQKLTVTPTVGLARYGIEVWVLLREACLKGQSWPG